MKSKVSIFWFRRDLRLDDNIGLAKALSSEFPVLPIFIFDPNILDKLEDKNDRRVDFIHQALQHINASLSKYKSSLFCYLNKPLEAFEQLFSDYDVQAIYCNRDEAPYAIDRDRRIASLAKENAAKFYAFKDQVIFDRNDILKPDGTPYTVYSYYAKKWYSQLAKTSLEALPMHVNNYYPTDFKEVISLDELGFNKTDIRFDKPKLEEQILKHYESLRDFPAQDHTTHLGVHLRFGTISIRACVKKVLKDYPTWLSQLIWRSFFMQILYHFPYVTQRVFRAKYSLIPWRNNIEEFELWCQGKTGYPMVDAGMRQLNQTGYMHNRVRMIVASFLCKHLLIDWRWGEAYFAQKLDDYDLAANNGNWQWAAGTGCDASPYFRIFNPQLQAKKFDPENSYIQEWVPEFRTEGYPKPMVEHKFARERALAAYKTGIALWEAK